MNFLQMVTVAQDVTTVYLENKKAMFSSRSTGVLSANNSPMPKLGYFFLGNVIVLGLRSAYPNSVESLTIYKRGLPLTPLLESIHRRLRFWERGSSSQILGTWVVLQDPQFMGSGFHKFRDACVINL